MEGNKAETGEKPPASFGWYSGGNKEMEVPLPLADDVFVKNP